LKVTTDAAAADLLVIPHATTLHHHVCLFGGGDDAHCSDRAFRYLQLILSWVRTSYGRWNASGGRDHLILFSLDVSLGLFRGGGELLRSLQLATVGSNLGSLDSGAFDEARDVVTMPFGRLPPPTAPATATQAEGLTQRDIAAMVNGDGYGGCATCEWAPVMQRPHFIFFAGGLHGRRRRDIAAAVAPYAANDSRIFWRSTSTDLSPTEHVAALNASQFCLHLPGFVNIAWSGRLAHIVAAGCIPVIVVDNLRLPLSNTVDWRTFSLRMFEADAIKPGYIVSRLAAVTPAAMRRLQRNLARVAPAFRYGIPAQSGDASHWLVSAVWSRMLARHAFAPWGSPQRLILTGIGGENASIADEATEAAVPDDAAPQEWRYDEGREPVPVARGGARRRG